MGIIQVAVYLHIRNVAAASAAEGARYAANADVPPEQGAVRAHEILARGLGAKTASHLRCTGGSGAAPDTVRMSAVRCSGSIPVFFVPVGGVLRVDVTSHAVEESVADPDGSSAEPPRAAQNPELSLGPDPFGATA
jgi:hypothetical protein